MTKLLIILFKLLHQFQKIFSLDVQNFGEICSSYIISSLRSCEKGCCPKILTLFKCFDDFSSIGSEEGNYFIENFYLTFFDEIYTAIVLNSLLKNYLSRGTVQLLNQFYGFFDYSGAEIFTENWRIFEYKVVRFD
jgi:hypothetical protein